MVPEGLIVFVPSFEYAYRLNERLLATGTIDKINKKKKFFMEPTTCIGPGNSEKVLREYKNYILKQVYEKFVQI